MELHHNHLFHQATRDSELLFARPSHIGAGDLNQYDRFTDQELEREAHAGMGCMNAERFHPIAGEIRIVPLPAKVCSRYSATQVLAGLHGERTVKSVRYEHAWCAG